jgi:hypothetical protein
MKRQSQEQSDRNRRQPASGEIYHNGRWISVDDCRAPYTEQQQQPPPSAGRYTYDENGRQVWSDTNEQGY